MVSELIFYGDPTETGLTVTATLYDSQANVVKTGIAMTETVIGVSAIYTANLADVTPSVSEGRYYYRCFDNSVLLNTRPGEIIWDTERELDDLQLYTRIGLNKGDPFTDTPTQFSSQSGSIVIDVTGDGKTTTTQTRQ